MDTSLAVSVPGCLRVKLQQNQDCLPFIASRAEGMATLGIISSMLTPVTKSYFQL